jgi:hypothetical protein
VADLTLIERRVLEKLFDMSAGYVLNLSNRAFQELIQEATSKDIYAEAYSSKGPSKANRLRCFFEGEPNEVVAKALKSLFDWIIHENLSVDSGLLELARRIGDKLEKKNSSNLETGSVLARKYYTSRNSVKKLDLSELYTKLQSLYLLLRDKGHFAERAGILPHQIPDAIKHEARLALSFQPFPLTKWAQYDVTENHIFDVLEFLYDHTSKRDIVDWCQGDMGHEYPVYSYDEKKGRKEFRARANLFLSEYRDGYELTEDGKVLSLGNGGLQEILQAEIIAFDEANVDSKVRSAIAKWRNRSISMPERRDAIRDLADVFEWLKKQAGLSKALNRKDEAALFDIANNFAIRHHNQRQKSDYDVDIWYSWIFHFYLATYHASVRLLMRAENQSQAAGARKSATSLSRGVPPKA